jgi:TRAP-type C4-dicarboxylate transport system substrate-binding protein
MKHVIFALGAALFIGSSGNAAAQTELSYSPWNPPGYVVNQAVFPWMDKVAEVTEGRVTIVPRATGVGAPQDQFDAVRDGLVDVTLVVPGFNPGRFPLLEMGELPLLSSDAQELATVFNSYYEEHLAAFRPFAGTQVLGVWAVAPAQLVARNGYVETPQDLSGLKVRVANAGIAEGLTVLGAVPVRTPVSEAYAMVSSGAVDGMVMPFEPTVTWNLNQYLKYFTVVQGGLGQSTMALVVNEDKWNAISQEDRDAIMAISGGELASAVGAVVKAGEEAAVETLTASGVTFQDAPADLVTELNEAFTSIYQQWVAKAEAAGFTNAGDVLTDFRAEFAR